MTSWTNAIEVATFCPSDAPSCRVLTLGSGGIWQSKRLRKVAFTGWEKGDCGEAMKEVLSKGLPGVRHLHSPYLFMTLARAGDVGVL